jgi:hypothetical protein
MKLKFLIAILMVGFLVSCDKEELGAEELTVDPVEENDTTDDQNQEEKEGFYCFYIRNLTNGKITVYFNKDKSYFEGRELNEDDKRLTFSLEDAGAKQIIIGEGTLPEIMKMTNIKRIFIYKDGLFFGKYESEFYRGPLPDINFFNMDNYMKVDSKDYQLLYYNVRNTLR